MLIVVEVVKYGCPCATMSNRWHGCVNVVVTASVAKEYDAVASVS